ncbi:MAG: MAPEG family protein [Rhodobacteraceae bacterium]|nr:MAPEG family protein [Paracoccaceae bacterium]
MTAELRVLALAGLLQAVQYVLMAVAANRELGPRVTMGPRDHDIRAGLSPRTGRLVRALDNHVEALVLFTLAVLVVTLAERSSPLTAACAWTYLAARILYVPAYAFGLAPWRSLVWAAGWTASVIMILAALVPA